MDPRLLNKTNNPSRSVNTGSTPEMVQRVFINRTPDVRSKPACNVIIFAIINAFINAIINAIINATTDAPNPSYEPLSYPRV